MIEVNLEFPGAVPKGRPRFDTRSRITYTPARTREHQEVIAWEARVAMQGMKPSKRRFFVELTFWAQRKTADGDNLEKAVLDAVEGIIYENDNQVETVIRRKLVDTKRPRTKVGFRELADDLEVSTNWEIVRIRR